MLYTHNILSLSPVMFSGFLVHCILRAWGGGGSEEERSMCLFVWFVSFVFAGDFREAMG